MRSTAPSGTSIRRFAFPWRQSAVLQWYVDAESARAVIAYGPLAAWCEATIGGYVNHLARHQPALLRRNCHACVMAENDPRMMVSGWS
jgi:hypothetical protein